jgi:hypothetical protein
MLLRDIVYALNVSLAAYPHDHQVVVEEFLKEMHWHRKHGNLHEREQCVTDRLVEMAEVYLGSPTAARLAELQTAAETTEKFYDG